MNVSVVIVTFNRLNKLKKSYLSIRLQNPLEIIIVNNASTDGTQEWLANLKDNSLKVVNLPQNIGGAGGFYTGLKLAVENPKTEWILCYDDDAYPAGDLLNIFNKSLMMMPENVGAIASAVYLPNGVISQMNRPSYNPFGNFSRIVRTILMGYKAFHLDDRFYYEKGGYTEVDAFSFVGCFINANLIRQGIIGLPRKELFIYGDDILYTYSVKEAGYKNIFIPELIFFHDCETLVNQKKHYNPLWKAYYTYRNGLELYRRFAKRMFPFVAIVKIISWLLASRHYKKCFLKYLECTFLAILDGLRANYARSHDCVSRRFS